ncbi:sulfatase-like hydrolase/transferase, partial [Gemmatimonadota bacterium]
MSESLERRDFIRRVGLGTAALVAAPLSSCTRSSHGRPNIIFIVADDLGYAELGSYGQRKIRTPNLDRIAAEGMRFTQHYSGSPVCAPSRCVLLTGKHTGHSYIRANDEMSERGDVWRDPALEGQRPLPADTVTIGTLLQQEGYVTGAIGKWGLGGPGSTGEPNNQGFDHWYGYLCQRVAHNYYPTHLWRNREKDILEGNEYFYPHQRLPADRDPHDPDSYREYAGND